MFSRIRLMTAVKSKCSSTPSNMAPFSKMAQGMPSRLFFFAAASVSSPSRMTTNSHRCFWESEISLYSVSIPYSRKPPRILTVFGHCILPYTVSIFGHLYR
ncbi:MAG: hypothetical protein LUE09_00485 [Synergistaceae bacterium]|nr:hypothetical protein [Synergistaceae bacterium]